MINVEPRLSLTQTGSAVLQYKQHCQKFLKRLKSENGYREKSGEARDCNPNSIRYFWTVLKVVVELRTTGNVMILRSLRQKFDHL